MRPNEALSQTDKWYWWYPEAVGVRWLQSSLLRLHGLIERVPKTHRYRLTDLGLRTAMFYTRVYSRVLRPGLAVINPDKTPAANSPLQRTFRAAENAVNAWCDDAKIAA